MSHYKSNVRDQAFNLFDVFGLDKVLGTGDYTDLDADTAREMLSEMARLAEGPIGDSFADGRARTFLPLVPQKSGAVDAALVVPVRHLVTHAPDGSLADVELEEGVGERDVSVGRRCVFVFVGIGSLRRL